MGIRERRIINRKIRNWKENGILERDAAELQRIRELVIGVFKDESPFVNLGYTTRQTQFALPVIRLLEEEGKVTRPRKDQPAILHFFNPEDPRAEYGSIYGLEDGEGFAMEAVRDETLRDSGEDFSPEERVLMALTKVVNTDVFGDFDPEVAHIVLFHDGFDMTNLDSIMRAISYRSTRSPRGMKPETLTNSVTRNLGRNGTYRAAWVDEDTKLEFVARLDHPANEFLQPLYVAYRKLSQVEDPSGKMHVIGRKANQSEDRVNEILERKKDRVTIGRFAVEGI